MFNFKNKLKFAQLLKLIINGILAEWTPGKLKVWISKRRPTTILQKGIALKFDELKSNVRMHCKKKNYLARISDGTCILGILTLK